MILFLFTKTGQQWREKQQTIQYSTVSPYPKVPKICDQTGSQGIFYLLGCNKGTWVISFLIDDFCNQIPVFEANHVDSKKKHRNNRALNGLNIKAFLIPATTREERKQVSFHSSMKCTKRQIAEDGSGFVTLIPQEQEDLWHVVNLITLGDHLRASTWRCATPRII